MNHLSEEQLSALADDGPALRAGAPERGARAAAERHLESCPACREALAGLLAQDRDLRGALEHDPGEAYFEDFAARVGGRIRAAGLRGAQARVPEARGLAEWFRSPRKLAVVGAVATVVVGAGIVMLSTREVTMPALRHPAAEQPTRSVAPPAAVPAPAATDEARPTEAVTAPPPAAADGERSMKAAAPPVRRPLARRERGGVAVTQEEGMTPTPPAQDRVAAVPSAEEKLGGRAQAPQFGDVIPSPTAATTNEATATTEGAAAPEAGYGYGAEATTPQAARAPAPLRQVKQSLGAAKQESAADPFADQPTFTGVHGRNAQRLTALAETMRRAPAWDSAAEEWAMVLLGTQGTRLEAETRYQLARARWRAWQAGATEKRAAKAAEVFTAFLGMAPAGAQRDSVTAWSATLGR